MEAVRREDAVRGVNMMEVEEFLAEIEEFEDDWSIFVEKGWLVMQGQLAWFWWHTGEHDGDEGVL